MLFTNLLVFFSTEVHNGVHNIYYYTLDMLHVLVVQQMASARVSAKY